MNRQDFTLLDAAHGTRLIDLGLELHADDPAFWVLRRPESIRELHLADLKAGAQVITTCTFGANRQWLARFGSVDTLEVNRRAVEIVRSCIHETGAKAEIAGCIGPTTIASETVFREQFDALCESDVNRIIIETLAADQVIGLTKVLPDRPGCPVYATLWNWGDDPVGTARQLADAGITGWGINCMTDRSAIRQVLVALHAAGLPASILKLSIAQIGDFTDAAIESLSFGTNFIGGCCGTDHRHLATLRAIRDAARAEVTGQDNL